MREAEGLPAPASLRPQAADVCGGAGILPCEARVRTGAAAAPGAAAATVAATPVSSARLDADACRAPAAPPSRCPLTPIALAPRPLAASSSSSLCHGGSVRAATAMLRLQRGRRTRGGCTHANNADKPKNSEYGGGGGGSRGTGGGGRGGIRERTKTCLARVTSVFLTCARARESVRACMRALVSERNAQHM